MSNWVECLIDSVRVSLTNQDRIVVLKDKHSERYLPIWVGLYEAESITIALQKISVARPLTHDLIISLLNALDVKLISMEITSLESDTYYANLVIEQNGELKYIDCRPSDALALVTRSEAPIYVDEEVMLRAAIRPEDVTPVEQLEESDEQKPTRDLSVFENFLDQLDKKQPGRDEDEKPGDQPEKPAS